VTIRIEKVQELADTAVREKVDGRSRLNLTIFSRDDGSVWIYTAQVGKTDGDVVAVEPRLQCSSRLEAAGALAEILRMIEVG
jgi:hypothetical protein